jgi:hypothetical protein
MESYFGVIQQKGKRLFTTQKKVIKKMANAQERELSGSLFKQFSTPPTCQ